MFGSELIGMVDSVVTGVAESCLVGGAEHRGIVLVTYITLDLHQFEFRLQYRTDELAQEEGKLN